MAFVAPGFWSKAVFVVPLAIAMGMVAKEYGESIQVRRLQ